MRVRALCLMFPLLMLWLFPANAATAPEWITESPQGTAVHLYFFWSKSCPHCQEALPFVSALAERHSWLRVHAHEVTTNRENARLYVEMAGTLGQEATSVPGFLFCGEMVVGYDTPSGVGRDLEQRLLACRDRAGSIGSGAAPAPAGTGTPSLPGLDLDGLSLPLVTVIIAGLDAFNPCAFFVLLFLLSLLAHERTRVRMLVVGGIFVLCSGLVYFALMAAWLNVFLVAGELRFITALAGALAIAMAAVNIKDYFWFKRGISLSIPERAKPKLFERMRGLLRAESLPVMLAGAVVLAVAANSYEALCTAGFPMVYTRLLTLHDLPRGVYYSYLALYNAIYVVPLLVIVAAFAWTLGSRKLSEAEGRILKLVSGLMMLGLGGLLLLAPERLSDPVFTIGLVALAALSGGIAYYQRVLGKPRMPRP